MNNEKKKRNQTNLIAEEEKHEHNGIKNHNNIQNHLEPKLNFNHNQNWFFYNEEDKKQKKITNKTLEILYPKWRLNQQISV